MDEVIQGEIDEERVTAEAARPIATWTLIDLGFYAESRRRV